MIVVVTGSRDYTEWRYVCSTLDEVHRRSGPITEIRHGAMCGADALASKWAHLRKVNVRPFGAQWGDDGDDAGPMRNRAMLNAGPKPDLVVAFPLPGSRGTWDCVKAAKQRGIATFIAGIEVTG